MLDMSGPEVSRAEGNTEAQDAKSVQTATDRSPDNGTAARRRRAVVAGYRGDVTACRELLGDPDRRVREAAVGALGRAGAFDSWALATGLADPDPAVRRRALEEAGRVLAPLSTAGTPTGLAAGDGIELLALATTSLDDPDPAVAETAAWAVGEAGASAEGAVGRLVALCRHPNPLCREAAVAALGAIGHPGGLGAVLEALEDKAPVRRRAVLALAAFDDPGAEAGLRRAASDRDWQVRQAAEDLLEER